jgi:hypothetical protein
VLAALIGVATVIGVVVVPRLRPATRPDHGGVLRHPGTWLGVVVALFGVNQVLVTAFVVQRWNGDPSRVTRFLPPGWFDLADLGPLAEHLPAWPWTVLHVQAVLELPFVVLAYLLVCRWWCAETAARVIAARWFLVASWTAVFCLVELDLRNPWTTVDVVLRIVAGVGTALALPLLGTGDRTAPGLVSATVSAGALGCLVLAVYDVATLYNTSHLVGWLPVASCAAVALAVARRVAARPGAWDSGAGESGAGESGAGETGADGAGPLTASAVASLGWFLVCFAVPALPLRYGIGFGAAPVSAVAGVVVVLAALRLGWDRSAVRGLVVAVVVGALAAACGFLVARGYPEARLLAAAAGFVLGAAATTTVLDRRRRARRPG